VLEIMENCREADSSEVKSLSEMKINLIWSVAKCN